MADTAYLPVDDELAVLRRRVGQLERFLAEDAVNYDALTIAERRTLEFATLADRETNAELLSDLMSQEIEKHRAADLVDRLHHENALDVRVLDQAPRVLGLLSQHGIVDARQ